eukprot:4749238-Pyramimonas_sp.AAC.1
MAVMSLDSVIRSGGRLVLVGDPKQLPPAVISRKAADQGLCLSIFDRLHHAMPWGAISLQWCSSAFATVCAPCNWHGRILPSTTTRCAPASPTP